MWIHMFFHGFADWKTNFISYRASSIQVCFITSYFTERIMLKGEKYGIDASWPTAIWHNTNGLILPSFPKYEISREETRTEYKINSRPIISTCQTAGDVYVSTAILKCENAQWVSLKIVKKFTDSVSWSISSYNQFPGHTNRFQWHLQKSFFILND